MAQQNGIGSGRRYSAFDFKKDQNDVIIRHAHGAQLRANPTNHQYIDHKGGQGDWSKWNIHFEDNNQVVLIQNQKTRKYLTIDKKATEFMANGEGFSIYCRFRTHYNNEGFIQLESLAYPGHYLSVRPHEGVVIETQENAPGNYFQILTHGVSEDDIYFVKPYHFQKENVVIICHPHNGGIAIIQGKLSDKGTKENHSRWIAIPHMSPNIISNTNNTTTSDVSVIQPQQQSPSPQSSSTEKQDVKSGDNTLVSTKTSETNNSTNNSNNANDNNTMTNHDEKNNSNTTGNNNEEDKKNDPIEEKNASDCIQTIKLRHEETHKYLMINEKREVELTDGDTEYGLFKVHVITKPNIVKFESWKVIGAYIDVKEGGVMVGKGGPHSQMTVLRKQ